MFRKMELLCLAIMLGIALLPKQTLAQESSYLESRISRLESETYQLRSQMRSQINQLQSQLQGQNQSPSGRTGSTKPAPPIAPRGNRPASADPMFDRLATLVIELKQRINKLEAQVAELQKQRR
ncbi:hypothetical protein [Coleofasciculus sp. FACHB-SPT9]|uniref:hypothetical protein n=1 Tax=Cyanophyceae TaxID=3028117 RepID=UPI001687ECB6|nr:hypothetical protein [Coleofasciculus sp. FACHB-SPT9]MBD1891299.1 hypothetical protein [Coleofasciculus sp. FACHB-SPT9]